jgi:hypothetical protein
VGPTYSATKESECKPQCALGIPKYFRQWWIFNSNFLSKAKRPFCFQVLYRYKYRTLSQVCCVMSSLYFLL